MKTGLFLASSLSAFLFASAADAGTFCVKRGIFPEPNSYVRIGSCAPEGGGCVSLPRLNLFPSGSYICGSMQTDMNRRFSFPAKGKRLFGVKQGDRVVFDG